MTFTTAAINKTEILFRKEDPLNPPRSRFGRRSTAEEVTTGIDLRGKTAVVTGCNSGVGLETMRVLSLRGAEVIGVARTLEAARTACGKS